MATLTTAALPSSAERSVREVALRLGIPVPNVDHVVLQMRQEYVLTDWQLSALDSFQWKSLGAPIGLAVAVHQIIQQEQHKQQQKLFVFPPADHKTTHESKFLHDLDQHNNIMESAIFGIHNSNNNNNNNSMDHEEKEETEAPMSSRTVVDAAVQETSIVDNQESEKQDEKSQNSEATPEVDAASKEDDYLAGLEPEGDTASNENGYLTELLVDTKTESSIVVDNTPDKTHRDNSIDDADISNDNAPPQEPEDEHVNDADVSVSSTTSSIEDDSDKNADSMLPAESSDVMVARPKDKSEEHAKPDSLPTAEDAILPLDKSYESSSSWDATASVEDVDTVPTTAMSEETTSVDPRNLSHYYYKQEEEEEPSSVSPTLSAPLPHDECDDSFHVSSSKELLLKPSFDFSEDISEDLESFGGGTAAATTNSNNEQDTEEEEQGRGGADNKLDFLERNLFQEQSSQSLDVSLDPEDDIIIASGEDLLVDLSAQAAAAVAAAATPLESLTTITNQKQETDDALEGALGSFRRALADPNSVTMAEFRTGSDLDEDGGLNVGEPSITEDDSFSQPYTMHKRAVSSLESLYFVDGDECTVVASNVSPQRRNRPKRRRSLEDSTGHTIHTSSHVSFFDVEWDEFCLILKTIPNSKTQRTILSQLLIMTNGRTKSARLKMAKQISQMILKAIKTIVPPSSSSSSSSEEEKHKKAQTAQLKSNLQLFAKLHREERKAFGKKIFEQISKLYASGDDLDDNDDEKKETKATTKTTETPTTNNAAAARLEKVPPLSEDDDGEAVVVLEPKIL